MAGSINPVDTLACTYASLMLNDAGVPVTAESIDSACRAAGLTVRDTLPILFARFLEKKSIESLFAAAAAVAPQEGAVAAAPAAPAAGGAAAGGAAAADAGKKEEEEEDDDMGFLCDKAMAGSINPVDTLACTYASLMLNDAGVPVTAESIDSACRAAGLTVRDTLPILFARFLEKKSIESLFAAAAAVAPQEGAVAAAPAAPAAGGAAAGGAAAADAGKKEEEEEDDDMGFGLFD